MRAPRLCNVRGLYILRKDLWVSGGSENGNFPLLYVIKISLHRGVGGSKKPQTPLRNIYYINAHYVNEFASRAESFLSKSKTTKSCCYVCMSY